MWAEDIPATRIFSLHNAAKCVAAMFSNRPELAARYPKQMYEELTKSIFADDTKEAVFYASCVTMYRFNLLVSNSVIPQNMKRFKWHMLPLVRAIVASKDVMQLNSKKAEQELKKIIEVMGQHGQPATDVFNRVVSVYQGLGEVSGDRLKRQTILSEALAMV